MFSACIAHASVVMEFFALCSLNASCLSEKQLCGVADAFQRAFERLRILLSGVDDTCSLITALERVTAIAKPCSGPMSECAVSIVRASVRSQFMDTASQTIDTAKVLKVFLQACSLCCHQLEDAVLYSMLDVFQKHSSAFIDDQLIQIVQASVEFFSVPGVSPDWAVQILENIIGFVLDEHCINKPLCSLTLEWCQRIPTMLVFAEEAFRSQLIKILSKFWSTIDCHSPWPFSTISAFCLTASAILDVVGDQAVLSDNGLVALKVSLLSMQHCGFEANYAISQRLGRLHLSQYNRLFARSDGKGSGATMRFFVLLFCVHFQAMRTCCRYECPQKFFQENAATVIDMWRRYGRSWNDFPFQVLGYADRSSFFKYVACF
ncbi:unnamed protein product [Soboliphyme baturini]|uniref:Uncharacterized protein n=1 Tax=Soboliphyme baturini TaxID=241478 RepID=A0A183J0C2_9BILA|nr:unnamed protein product [Soboliphyme baturini]